MRKLKLGNKKAAFEMSITTIVILVIALSMLIFGMIFVRKMMCSGMGLMEGVTAGTQTEINKMFSTSGGDIQCLGGSEKIQDIYPSGTMQNIYCGFKAEKTGTTYTFTVQNDKSKITADQGLDPATVSQWIRKVTPNTVTVIPGKDKISSVAFLNIPKSSSEGFFMLTIDFVKKVPGEADVPSSEQLKFQIKRAGAIQSAIC